MSTACTQPASSCGEQKRCNQSHVLGLFRVVAPVADATPLLHCRDLCPVTRIRACTTSHWPGRRLEQENQGRGADSGSRRQALPSEPSFSKWSTRITTARVTTGENGGWSAPSAPCNIDRCGRAGPFTPPTASRNSSLSLISFDSSTLQPCQDHQQACPAKSENIWRPTRSTDLPSLQSETEHRNLSAFCVAEFLPMTA